jgi:hypothetical protein
VNDPAKRCCFVCGTGLGEEKYTRGTVFTAGGNYGSGVWDPFGGDLHLRIQVCDDCLTARQKLVHQVKIVVTQTENVTLWEGTTDEY